MAEKPSWHELGAFISLLFLRMSREYDWLADHLRDLERGRDLRYGSREPSGSCPSSPMLLDEANAMQFAIARSIESPMAQASALSLSLSLAMQALSMQSLQV